MKRERIYGLLMLGLLLLVAAACLNEDRSKKTERMLEGGKANPNAADKRPEKTVTVREDCSYEPSGPLTLSTKRAERAHWMLEGGSGSLAVELKSDVAEKRAAWKNDLVIRCAGAECWATLTPNARTGNQHEYRFVVDAKPCPDPVIIIQP